MSNNTLLFIIAVFVIAMFAILAYEFLNLNDFALFQSNPKQEPEHKHIDDLFRAEVMYTGVTLGSICELCPKTIFRVKDGHGGYFALDTEKVDEKKLLLSRHWMPRITSWKSPIRRFFEKQKESISYLQQQRSPQWQHFERIACG